MGLLESLLYRFTVCCFKSAKRGIEGKRVTGKGAALTRNGEEGVLAPSTVSQF